MTERTDDDREQVLAVARRARVAAVALRQLASTATSIAALGSRIDSILAEA